jgi:hypothetical protein
MDHHCFWINNCVGLGNMKYFFLTLVYGFCGCAFMVLMMAARWYSLAFGAKDPKPTDVECVILALATAGSFIHAGTVGYLLAFHAYLLYKGRTSVEHRCCKGEKPGCNFDNGPRANLEENLGFARSAWCLPVPPSCGASTCLASGVAWRAAEEQRQKLYTDHGRMAGYYRKRLAQKALRGMDKRAALAVSAMETGLARRK